MSRFDPKNKNTIDLKDRIFRERQLLLRSGGGVKHFVLTPVKQVFLFSFLTAFVLWTAFVSYMYVYNNNIIDVKNVNIKEARNSYSRLLEEVAVYKDHVYGLFSELESKQKDFAYLLTQGKSDVFGSKNLGNVEDLIKQTSSVKNEFHFIDARMEELSSKMSWAIVDQESLEYELRKVVLQRDIANSERDDLRNKVKDLEMLVAEMQDAQIQVIERMASLAEGGINSIEKNLKTLDSVLEKSGLKIEKLLDAGKDIFGQGGPFIPAELPDLRNEQLNKTFEEVNTKIDRLSRLQSLQERLPLGNPVEVIRITSGFGYRIDPFNGQRARHEGVDLGGQNGDNVYARATGRVVRAGEWGWYGKVVEVDHGLGFRTRYAHLSQIDVKKGDYVIPKQVIGRVGSTGRSTGNHLHYEVRIKNNPVNPMDFIKVKRNVFKG